MATSSQIDEVRQYTEEFREDKWSDEYIAGLVDSSSVYGAAWQIWMKKAAEYTDLVNVSEAGASHAFGDLQKKALEMVDRFRLLADEEEEAGGTIDLEDRARVKIIERF